MGKKTSTIIQLLDILKNTYEEDGIREYDRMTNNLTEKEKKQLKEELQEIYKENFSKENWISLVDDYVFSNAKLPDLEDFLYIYPQLYKIEKQIVFILKYELVVEELKNLSIDDYYLDYHIYQTKPQNLLDAIIIFHFPDYLSEDTPEEENQEFEKKTLEILKKEYQKYMKEMYDIEIQKYK